MKKLLITTMAAVSLAFCAEATLTEETFESYENEGSLFETYTDQEDGVEKYRVPDGWETETALENLFTVTNIANYVGAGTYPESSDSVKALAIDTSAPLLRYADDSEGSQSLSDAPIFFDSVVQFTATDVAPSMENNTTDKLAVWLYTSPDDVSDTNRGLFGETSPITRVAVTAGYSSDGVNLITKNYLTNIEVKPDTWHRLTIKSFNESADGDLLFNIWVDKTQVSGKETIEAQETTTDFLSRIPDSVGATFNKLQGVAFDGKGAVDDIVFTTTAPDFTKAPSEPTVETYTLSIVGENFTYEVYTDSEWGDKVTDLTAINTEYKTLWLGITPTENYELESIKLGNQTIELPEYNEEDKVYYLDELQISTGDIDNGAEFTLTITMKEKTGGGSGEEPEDPEDPEDPEVPAKPTIGGAPVETAEAFIAAANSGATIKVPADWTLVDNTLKDADGVAYATFADYYTVTLASDGTGTITLKLNNKAEPTIDETAADKGDAIVVTETEVALGVTNAKVGLWYGAQAYSDAACTTKICDEPTGWEQAKGTTVTVRAVKPDAGTAFFKVVVDDQDHTPPPAAVQE